jgi:hypothetical protein
MKRPYASIILHNITSQTIIIYVHTTVKTSNITDTDMFINILCVLHVAETFTEINTNMSMQRKDRFRSP